MPKGVYTYYHMVGILVNGEVLYAMVDEIKLDEEDRVYDSVEDKVQII